MSADRDALLDLLGAAERELRDSSPSSVYELGCAVDRTRRHINRTRPRLASEMPGWVGSEPPPDVLTEDDSWDRWPA